MARGVNKVIIIGNLGADPETRYTANGQAITTIRVATTDSWTDKTSGQKQEKTEWHRVKMFGRTAEIAGEYLKKGRQVYVEGRLETNKYTDKEGIERYSTEIVANDMQMIGGMAERGGAEMGAPRERPARPAAPQGGGRPAAAATPAVADQSFDEDDIPF